MLDYLRVDVPKTIMNGYEVVFHAPCDCSDVYGIVVHYPDKDGNETSSKFLFKDAHGSDLSDTDNLFKAGAYVKVILNVTGGIAYIQNADTNSYLEERFNNLETGIVSVEKQAVVTPTGEGNMLPINIMGDSYQKQLSGKNLADFRNIMRTQNGVTACSGENGVITVTGTPTVNEGIVFTVMIEGIDLDLLEIGKQYKANSDCGIQIEKIDGTVVYGGLFTMSEDITKVRPYIQANASSYVNGATYKPMLCLSDSDFKTYEPYCGGVPSPNPDFPQKIENVGVIRNLLDCSGLKETTVSGVTFTPVFDENGLLEYIEANGISTATSPYEMLVTLPKGKYILNGCPRGGNITTYTMQCKFDSTSGTALGQDDGNGLTFTLEEEKLLDIYIRIGVDYMADKLRFYPMIRPAFIEDSTYHPYTGEDVVEVKSVGKNIYDPKEIKYYSQQGVSRDGTKFTYNATKDSIIIGNNVQGGTNNLRNDLGKIRIFPNKKYYFSYKHNVGTAKHYVQFYNKDGEWVRTKSSSPWISVLGNEVEFESPEDAYYVVCNAQINNLTVGTTVVISDLYLALAEGTDYKVYEPYKEHKTLIHLDEPLRGIGDNRDTICQKDGVWGVERYRIRVVIDGINLKYGGYGIGELEDVIRFIVPLPKNAVHLDDTALCDSLKRLTNYSSNTEHFYVEKNQVWLFIPKEVGITQEEVNNYFKSNPFTLEYTLETPIFVPFEDQTPFWKMMAFDGDTTISIIGGSDNIVPRGEFRVGRNTDGGMLLTNYADNRMSELVFEAEVVKLEEEINELGENLEVVKETAENAYSLANTTTYVEVEDSAILTPTVESSMLLDTIKGDSYQKQIAGNQLFDDTNFRNITLGASHDNLPIKFKGAGTYSTICHITGGTEQGVTLILYFNDGTNKQVSMKSDEPRTFTLTDDEIAMFKKAMFATFSGSHGATLHWVMLNKGNTILPYEPFVGGTPSPNPEFPQEINNVGVIRNLLDCSGLVERTISGVTFTPVYDENGLLEYIEANGTASADSYYAVIKPSIMDNIFDDSYILSGCPKGGDSTKFRFLAQVYDDSNTWKGNKADLGDGTLFGSNYPKISFQIIIKAGYTANKLRFYPMIRPAHITDPTYHPYIPENKDNLIPYPYFNSTKTENGVTFTDNGDGSIKFVGTSTGYATFTLNTDWRPVPGNYKKNVGEKCDFKIGRFKRSNKSYDAVVVENNITVFDTSDWDFETYMYQLVVQIPSSLGAVDGMFNPRIVKNHIPAQGSQYAVEVKSVGKNVFNPSLVPEIINGVTITVDETIKASGTTTRETTKYLFKNTTNPIVSDKNGLFIKGAKTLIGMYYKAKIVKEDGLINYVDIGRYGYYVKPNLKIEEIYLQINSTGTFVSVEIEPQIVEGNIDLPFEPYQESRIPIHLDEPLRGIGDNRDIITQKDGIWGVERHRAVEVFDGSYDEGWYSAKSGDGVTYRICNECMREKIIPPLSNNVVADVICDSYSIASAVYTYNNKDSKFSIDILGGIRIYDLDFNTSDISLWTAHLVENPITLEYPLATPTFIPFEDQEQFYKFKSFNEVTTLSFIGEVDEVTPRGAFRVANNFAGGLLLSGYVMGKMGDKANSVMKEVETTVANMLNIVNTANNLATNAQTVANNALTLANTAKSTADTAKSTADTAKTSADNASSLSSSAKSIAEQAKTTAESAKTSADGALKPSDVVDNLESTNAKAPLSANMGNKLKNRHLLVDSLPSNPDSDTYYYIPEN